MLDKYKERIENARVGYEVANNSWAMSYQNYWVFYNALLVANSILLASIGWIFSKDNNGFLAYLSFVIIPIVGIVICIIWFFISYRSYAYCNYYLLSARKLEEYLSPVNTLSRGGKLSEGERVPFHFEDGEEKSVKIRFFPKFNTGRYSYLVIGLFTLIYLIVFFFGLSRISGCTLYTFQFRRSDEMENLCYLSLVLGITMIGISILGLWKSNNELRSRDFKFIAFLGTIITIIAILLSLIDNTKC